MPIEEHPSFERPNVTTRLWRYTDLPKFIELLTSGTLWLVNAEVLAANDPYEGLPGAIQFPHRMWKNIDEVPERLRRQILDKSNQSSAIEPEKAFQSWFMGEEQLCLMTRSGRRDFYVNCWHAAEHESVAMWKIYGSPGEGVAIVTNGGRLESALNLSDERLFLGSVRYIDQSYFQIGAKSVFDNIMMKRSNYEYEREVRLVHWNTGEMHDALANFRWNDETMRFVDLIDDSRPVCPGIALKCDLAVMVERVIISPSAPPWYSPMIKRLCERFGFTFPIQQSK